MEAMWVRERERENELSELEAPMKVTFWQKDGITKLVVYKFSSIYQTSDQVGPTKHTWNGIVFTNIRLHEHQLNVV